MSQSRTLATTSRGLSPLLLFQEIKKKWGGLDFVVHAVAFSDKSELSGEYLNTTRENFQRSMLISCFSFTEVAREAFRLASYKLPVKTKIIVD